MSLTDDERGEILGLWESDPSGHDLCAAVERIKATADAAGYERGVREAAEAIQAGANELRPISNIRAALMHDAARVVLGLLEGEATA